MKKTKLLICLLLINFNLGFCQVNLYVSTSGKDSNNGTSLGTAFKTIQKAKDTIRTLIPSMSSDIIVNIDAGTYVLNNTLVFNGSDSPTGNYKITYKAYNNTVVNISGGVTYNANQWTIHDSENSIWKLNIDTLYSRQVYKDGVKAKRARSDHRNDTSFEHNELTNYNLQEIKTGYLSFCSRDNFDNWDMAAIQKQRDLELVSNKEFISNRIPVRFKCKAQLEIADLIRFNNHKQQFLCDARVSWLENAYELINEPNEWYIDRSGSDNILYFKTADNQPPANVTIPQLETLIDAAWINNTIFDGLVFQYATWKKPSEYLSVLDSNEGLAVVQADWCYDLNIGGKIIPGAVRFDRCNTITFIKNTFEHIGSIGLQFLEYCNNNIVCNNEFRDICASAISIGHPEHLNSENNKITNNLIHNIANEYFSGVGIFAPTGKYTKITHNDISNFPNVGIAVGWGWTSDPIWNIGPITIEYNKIDCSQQFTDDNAGIYTLGPLGTADTGRSSIKHNYIKNFHRRYGGIYLDQGSSYINVCDNVIEDNSPTAHLPDSYINWMVMSWYDAHYIKCKNNYYSYQYLTNVRPPFVEQDPPVPDSDNYIIEDNYIMGPANSTQTTAIKNNSGRQSIITCPNN